MMTLMVEAVLDYAKDFFRALTRFHDVPVKFWELWKCEFWKLCFHLCVNICPERSGLCSPITLANYF